MGTGDDLGLKDTWLLQEEGGDYWTEGSNELDAQRGGRRDT